MINGTRQASHNPPLLIALRDGFPERSVELQAAVIAVMGAAGVALGGLQLAGATGLAAGVAVFLKRSRESQDQTELLMAELEDVRDEQARPAAIAERGRIAGELHDVLAHSLSGAAIQLQGARKLADHNTPPRV